jgi:hypothetical protein
MLFRRNKMTRTKMTVLRPWQKEISKADWEKKVLAHDRNAGFNPTLNKFYVMDLTNPEYIKYITEKKAAKSQARKDLRKHAYELGLKKGATEALKTFKKSDVFKKILESKMFFGSQKARLANGSELFASFSTMSRF